MATHSSVLAWRISGVGEPGELPSMGSHRVGHYLAVAATKISLTFFKELEQIILKFDLYGTLLLLSHFSHVRLCVTPYMAAHQTPPSLGFSRQEYWSGLTFPAPMHESEK